MFLLTKCSALVCSLHLTTLTGASIGREFTIETETNTGRMSGEIADLDPGAERNNVITWLLPRAWNTNHPSLIVT